MPATVEKRNHPRVRLSWPLFFGYDENGEMFRAQLTDLSRTGVSFTIQNESCPPLGSVLLTRFSYPRDLGDGFDMDSYYFWAGVVRIDALSSNRRRVALELHRPLDVDPVPDQPMLQGLSLAQSA